MYVLYEHSLVEASINKPSSIAKLVRGLNRRTTPRSPRRLAGCRRCAVKENGRLRSAAFYWSDFSYARFRPALTRKQAMTVVIEFV